MYLETPEGIELPLRPAGLPVRVLAFVIDLLLRAALLALTGAAWLYLGKFGSGLASITAFMLLWWYMVLFEVFNQGRTPGKQLLGLQVIHSDGTPVGWAGSLTRNLLRVVDLLPFAYCVGILSILSNANFQRLGDLAAGTLVVYQGRPSTRLLMPDVSACPAPIPLTLAEQQAIIGFSERQQRLSTQRSEELAAIIAPALQVPPVQAVTRLHSIARGIVGQV
ncbi:RDD family protein [Pseudomonas sp. C27(2019)]|uniref:RDD family protein n=1 Tax=Pseudomonas sp. C27(2019) TaxID=2604941 RepID=UPI001248727E|nr:RDD family protein [Pseudomonas sp. C27(2019)]QEY60379.1 RDD family protein [Pseudomonas sp. C27(2019)]